jgi:hypothetical protein
MTLRVQELQRRGVLVRTNKSFGQGGATLPGPIAAILALLCVFLIVSNIVLITGLLKSRQRFEASQHTESGNQFSMLSGQNVAGSPVTVRYSSTGPSTLMLVFAPGCRPCMANSDNWKVLLQVADTNRTRVVGVSLESHIPADYVAQIGLANYLVLIPDIENVLDYRFRMTPQTILLSPSGTVEAVWSGLLDSFQLAEIKRAILGAASMGRSALRQDSLH